MTRAASLTDEQRSELYQGLGRTLSAGLSAVQAVDALEGILDGAVDPRLRRAGNAVRKGTALPLALFRQGLLPERDWVLLTTADESGTLDRVFERLAERHARSAARWRRMKARLLLPAAVLVIAIIVLPVPALASGALGIGAYLKQTSALLGLFTVISFSVSRSIRHWRATGTPGWLTVLARLLPGLAGMSRLHQRADICERLSLGFASGLPANDTLTAMRHAETNSVRRAALVATQSALGGGTGVADALERAGILDASTYAIISAGEASGRLDDTLIRVAAGCHDALDDAYTLLAQWIPVVLYVMVAGVVAVGLLG